MASHLRTSGTVLNHSLPGQMALHWIRALPYSSAVALVRLMTPALEAQ